MTLAIDGMYENPVGDNLELSYELNIDNTIIYNTFYNHTTKGDDMDMKYNSIPENTQTPINVGLSGPSQQLQGNVDKTLPQNIGTLDDNIPLEERRNARQAQAQQGTGAIEPGIPSQRKPTVTTYNVVNDNYVGELDPAHRLRQKYTKY